MQRHMVHGRNMLGAHAVQRRKAGSALLPECPELSLICLSCKRYALCMGPVQLQATLQA